jgi:hypothetical protein
MENVTVCRLFLLYLLLFIGDFYIRNYFSSLSVIINLDHRFKYHTFYISLSLMIYGSLGDMMI